MDGKKEKMIRTHCNQCHDIRLFVLSNRKGMTSKGLVGQSADCVLCRHTVVVFIDKNGDVEIKELS